MRLLVLDIDEYNKDLEDAALEVREGYIPVVILEISQAVGLAGLANPLRKSPVSAKHGAHGGA